MQVDVDYGFEITGFLKGQKENPYDYDFKFSIKPNRKISVEELNNFFIGKNLIYYSGVHKFTSTGIEINGVYKALNLSEVKILHVDGASDYRCGDGRDYFNFYLGLIYEFENKFYFEHSGGGGHDDNCGATSNTEEISKEQAANYNPLLF